eukprot:m.87569 g.87569  ORF g.87569 m.87569 type:complete len:580 (-) comp8325_c0_seq1:168-1907(-)
MDGPARPAGDQRVPLAADGGGDEERWRSLMEETDADALTPPTARKRRGTSTSPSLTAHEAYPIRYGQHAGVTQAGMAVVPRPSFRHEAAGSPCATPAPALVDGERFGFYDVTGRPVESSGVEPLTRPNLMASVAWRMDRIKEWFEGFNDAQRNESLRALLGVCGPSQEHLLSLLMEKSLHVRCEEHCRDPLAVLPRDVALHVLSFLDEVTLCRIAQVSRSWLALARDPGLWRVLALQPELRLSPEGEQHQLDAHSWLVDGHLVTDWYSITADRFRLRRNWLRGRFSVRTFLGHEQGVACVQLDDTRIASGSSDCTIKVWSTRTNAPWSVLTLRGHLGAVRCLHMRGGQLVSGSSDHTIRVWDIAEGPDWLRGSCRLTITGHTDTVRCLHARGAVLVSGSYDTTLRVWELATGTCRHVLRGHDGPVLSVQFDDKHIVSGGMDAVIRIWSFETGRCVEILKGHRGGVTCLQFSSQDGRIISGALDGDLRIWNMFTGQCIETLDWIRSEGHTGVIRQLQADQWRVVTASDDKTVKVWDLRTRSRLLTLRCHSDGVTCVHFNDRALVSGSFDESVKLLDFSAC